jgi:hypothetical protein
LRTDFPPAFSEADILVETQPGERILRLYEHWDKPDKVAEWKKKLQNRPTDTPRP